MSSLGQTVETEHKSQDKERQQPAPSCTLCGSLFQPAQVEAARLLVCDKCAPQLRAVVGLLRAPLPVQCDQCGAECRGQSVDRCQECGLAAFCGACLQSLHLFPTGSEDHAVVCAYLKRQNVDRKKVETFASQTPNMVVPDAVAARREMLDQLLQSAEETFNDLEDGVPPAECSTPSLSRRAIRETCRTFHPLTTFLGFFDAALNALLGIPAYPGGFQDGQ